MEIYIEVIILDNFIIDYIILYLCGMTKRRKSVWWRLSLASVLGVIIAFVSLASIGSLAMLSLKILASVGMVLIAFGKNKFLKTLMDFYIFTFAIGGTAMGLLYLKEGVNFGIFSPISSIPTGVIFALVFVGYIVAKRIIYIFNGRGVKSQYTYLVKLENTCMSRLTYGFLDTGNMLVFGDDLRGVCICEYTNMASLFKGQKPRGQVVVRTASGDDFLNVYTVAVMKVYEISCDKKDCDCSVEKLIFQAENVPVALSKIAMFEDFGILLSPRLFY